MQQFRHSRAGSVTEGCLLPGLQVQDLFLRKSSSVCGAGLFSDADWTCTSCGNTNWARRSTCNLCNGPKPGTVDQNREGLGGGFKVRHRNGFSAPQPVLSEPS